MPVVGAVLVQDRKPRYGTLRRTAFCDIDDTVIEIPFLAGYPLIDRSGDDMRDATPILALREIGETGHLRLGEHVPETEFDTEPSILLKLHAAVDQGLGIDHPPIGEDRKSVV